AFRNVIPIGDVGAWRRNSSGTMLSSGDGSRFCMSPGYRAPGHCHLPTFGKWRETQFPSAIGPERTSIHRCEERREAPRANFLKKRASLVLRRLDIPHVLLRMTHVRSPLRESDGRLDGRD